MPLVNIIKDSFHRVGVEITRYFPQDLDPDANRIIRAALPYTMTSPARIASLIQAVRYIIRNQIPGDIVECGVWKGGSMVAAALTLQSLGVTDRKLYLYDTFEGMTPPSEHDVSVWGSSASSLLKRKKTDAKDNMWCYAPLDAVRKTLLDTGYPSDQMIFVKGKVEDNLPGNSPKQIALLRLDTDWYESTKHELISLYPFLSKKGVLIIDDYGAWLGARKAVDEYFEGTIPFPLLCRIDESGRMAIKP